MCNRQFYSCLYLLVLSACTASSPWKFDSIATGEKAFDSSRLIYADQKSSPLRFEMVRLESGVAGFISLTKHKLTPSSEDPHFIEAQFTIDGEKIVESIPILEGRMRLKLPQELTGRLIEALQDGKQIDILLDGFEQTLEPERFSKLYNKLGGSAAQFANSLKGPIE